MSRHASGALFALFLALDRMDVVRAENDVLELMNSTTGSVEVGDRLHR